MLTEYFDYSNIDGIGLRSQRSFLLTYYGYRINIINFRILKEIFAVSTYQNTGLISDTEYNGID
jgi:hypothetical protein